MWSPQTIVAVVVDHADAVGVAVERDAEVRAFALVTAAIRSSRFSATVGIGMVVRERAVALAEQARARRRPSASKQLRRDERAGAVAAVDTRP